MAKTSKKKPTKLSLSNMPNEIFFFALFLIVVIGIATKMFILPALEKRQFEKLDKQAYEYIQTITQNYPGEIKHQKYCDYSSAKFSKGSLGCHVISTKDIDKNFNVSIMSINTPRDWGSPKDITSWASSEDRIRKNLLFMEKKNPNCSIAYIVTEDERFEVSAECSGNAIAEHYPVRKR